MYKDLVDNGIVDPNCANYGWEETDENFATGIVSSYVTGNWLSEREVSNPDTMGDVAVRRSLIHLTGMRLHIWSVNHSLSLPTARIKMMHLNLQQRSAAMTGRRQRLRIDLRVRTYLQTANGALIFRNCLIPGITFPPVTLGGITQAMQDALAMVLQEGEAPESAAEWLGNAVNDSLADSGELSE